MRNFNDLGPLMWIPSPPRPDRKLRAIPGGSLRSRAILHRCGKVRPPIMANRAIWSMRKRHEWLQTPLKKKRVKRATRVRCGMQDAIDRKSTGESK